MTSTEKEKFYFLIQASNGKDILFPTNAEDLAKVRNILACRKKYSNLININDTWFEVNEKKDEDGNLETILFDITEHVIDSLTGIFKYKYFDSLLKGYIEGAVVRREPFSIVMADIDDLRGINNTYGHQIGDEVLSGVGETLINTFRLKSSPDDIVEKRKKINYNQKDIFTRAHGDEFIILLPNISLEDSKRKINTIKQNIANIVIDVNGVPLNLASMSFGIFYVDEEYYKKGYTDIEYIVRDILNQADSIMYRNKSEAKNNGKSYRFGNKPQ